MAAPLHIAAISTGATLAVVLWVPPGPSAARIAALLLLIAALEVRRVVTGVKVVTTVMLQEHTQVKWNTSNHTHSSCCHRAACIDAAQEWGCMSMPASHLHAVDSTCRRPAVGDVDENIAAIEHQARPCPRRSIKSLIPSTFYPVPTQTCSVGSPMLRRIASSAAQLLAAVAWVVAICYDSRQQDAVAATDGGRQLQSSWRAMERLELWCVAEHRQSTSDWASFFMPSINCAEFPRPNHFKPVSPMVTVCIQHALGVLTTPH